LHRFFGVLFGLLIYSEGQMTKYAICVVSKEYRYLEIEAETESDAVDKAWDKVACGFTADTKPEDTDTDLYVEGVVDDEE